MYLPSEDTFLLIKCLESAKLEGKILEIGVGSGEVIKTVLSKAEFCAGCDMELETLKQIRSELPDEIELVCCDSGKCFMSNSYDVIMFNPPYLPSKKIIDHTIDGGRVGNEVILKFLDVSLRLVKSTGSIFFVTSSLADVRHIIDFVEKRGFICDEVAKEHYMFEVISVFRCRQSS